MKLNLGVCPTSEQHPCIGFRAYESRTEKLMERWRDCLYKKFPQMHLHGTLSFDSTPTDRYGKELHLTYTLSYGNEAFAAWMMNLLPETWADCEGSELKLDEPVVTAMQGHPGIEPFPELYDFGLRGPSHYRRIHQAQRIKDADAMHNHLTLGKYLRKP